MSVPVLQFKMSRQSSARQQIATHMREMILSGQAPVGYKFPSNQELADQWQVASSSVHAAMTVLVKEGLVERTPKRGTFVTKRSENLTHVGIYLQDNIWQIPAAAFRRLLVAMLCERLKLRGIIPDIWIDSRSAAEQKTSWPDLVQAVNQRRIQGLVLGSVEDEPLQTWLSRLKIPTVACTVCPTPNTVYFASGAGLAARELVRQGCRSVGMIVPLGMAVDENDSWGKASGINEFCRLATELGVVVRDEWVQHPTVLVQEHDAEQFGYTTMKRLLAMPQRPEGIFVTHDWVARGAVMAIMEDARDAVPERLKLVLHRNVEVGFLCPVPVTFLAHRVADMAEIVIRALDAQLRGEEVGTVMVSPTITVPVQGAGGR